MYDPSIFPTAMADNANRSGQQNVEGRSNRRRFLRRTAGIVSVGGLASVTGCTGGGSGGGSSGSGGTSGNSNSSSGSGSSGANSFQWWDYAGNASTRAKKRVQSRTKEFESNSNTDVEVSIYGYSDITGTKWRSLFSQGRYPPVIDNFSIYNGPFIEQGYLKPMNEWIDWFSDDVKQAIEWTRPILKKKNTGFSGEAYSLPWGVKSYPFLVRADHWEEAGLSQDEFPPTSYDDLIKKAKTLRSEGPGEWGYQIVGQKFDVADTDLPSWTIAEGGQKGLFFNKDFSDVLIDNETWINTFKRYVDVYREHELSSPATPQASDEQNMSRLLNGTGSMMTANIGAHPTILNRAPKLAKNGNVKYGTFWGPGVLSFYSFSFTTAPDGTDPKKWEKKQKKAVKMIENQWFAPEKQKASLNYLGMMPVRKDTWDSTSAGGNTNLVDVEANHIEECSLGWRNHPELTNLIYTVMPPQAQQALKGEISADEALKNAAQEIRRNL